MKKFLLSIFAVLFAFAGVQAQVWTKVTKASDLKAGDKVVIVAKDYNYAMSTTQKTNNRTQQAVTKSGNEVTWVSGVQEFELKSGTKSDTFAFYTGSGYLYAASSSSNHLKTQNTNNDNGSWAITIAADGTATVKAQGTNTRNVMQYNQSSSLFACYSSASQKAICIYKYTEGGGTVAKVELPQISVANNSTIEVGSEITITPAADNIVSCTINGGNRVVIKDGEPVAITAEQAGTMTLAITTVCGDETLSETYNYTVKPVKPSINPDATSFEDELEVSITAEDGASIYYTTDGNDPTTESSIYSTPFTITETRTVKAIAVSNGVASDVAEATYTKNEPVTPPAEGEVVDVLTSSDFTATTNEYKDFSGVSKESGAVYAGQSAKSTKGGIQLRSKNSNSGIVTTKSGGKVKSVTIEVESGTNKLDIYGKNTPYTAASDLYDTSKQGTKLGTLSANGTLAIEGGYEYIGMRSNSGAMYLTSVSITWNTSAGATPVAPTAPSLTESQTFKGSMMVTITSNATVYYTTDGTDPTKDSEVYSGPFEITETTTVKAIAVNEVGTSDITEATYTLFVVEETTGYYVKVASEPADWTGKYLVVYEDEATAYVFNGKDQANGYVTASINGAIIKANSEIDAVAVTIEAMENGYSVNTADGYIYGAEGSNALKFGNTAEMNTIAYVDGEGVKIVSNTSVFRFNSASNGMRFRYYKSETYDEQKPVQLYKYVTELPSYQLTVTNAGWATLYLDFPAKIPTFTGEEAKEYGAYIVTAVETGYVTLTKVTGVLPANTGILFKANAGDYTFAYSADKAADVAGNLLEGSVKDKNVEGEAYVLGVVDGEVGLYKAKAAGTSWKNNANKAYLPIASGAAMSANLRFDFSGTTAIEEVETETAETVIYDLTGRRVNEITKAGVYIVNGHKVMVK